MGRWRNSPFCWRLSLACAANPPHFFGACPKKWGGAPKKSAWGGGAPVRFRDPPASPTRVGAATRPLRCPLRGRIASLAAAARGLGWRKSSQVKVFCPAFLQKSGRGPGAEPLGVSLCSQSAGGGQRGNPRRGFPLCGRPLRFADVRSHPTPGGDGTPPLQGVGGTWQGGRWTNVRVVEDADPYGPQRGRAACRGV